jgi:hypothetical protein
MDKAIIISIAIVLSTFIMTIGSCVSSKSYQEEKTKRKEAVQAYCLKIYKLNPTTVPRDCQF